MAIENWQKSQLVEELIFGGKGTEKFEKWPTFGQKWPISDIFAAPKALQENFSRKFQNTSNYGVAINDISKK